MRYRIKFKVENEGAILPFKHQIYIESVIEQFKNKHKAYTDVKEYTFSSLKGQYKTVSGGLMVLSQHVILVISSGNGQFVEELTQSILNERAILVGDVWLAPETSFSEPVPDFSEEVKYLCLSPLMITDPTSPDSSIIDYPSEQVFSDYLYESTLDRMEMSGLYTEGQLDSFFKFQFVPDWQFLERLYNEGKPYYREYFIPKDKDYITVQGYTIPFTLLAAPEVHNFIYLNGLGLFTCSGYGMLDRTDNESVKKKGKFTERENVV